MSNPLRAVLCTILLTRINFNPNKDNYIHNVSDDITFPLPNFNGCTDEVWEWINDFIETL